MLEDAGSPANDEVIDTDLCIVGSGPVGISIARELSPAGWRICLLESGGRDPSRQARQLNRGESIGYPLRKLHRSRVRAFGGTSRHWIPDRTWAMRPLDPIDFETRDAIPHSGWPIKREDLEPWYARAHEACDLGPYDYDPTRWTNEPRTSLLPVGVPEIENTMFQHGPGTFEHRWDELVRDPNVRLFLNATVTDLVPDDGFRRVERVEVRREDGSRFLVRPRFVVLAAGGIENPRLLLLGERARGRALGNDHGLVGRFFAERLSARTGLLVPNDPTLASRIVFYDFHEARGTIAQGAVRVADDVARARGLPNFVFFVLARPEPLTSESVRSLATLAKGRERGPLVPGVTRHVRNVVKGVGDVGAYALGKLRVKRTADAVVIRAQGEQLPNPNSRLTLGERRDRFGLPVARVDWRPGDARELVRAVQDVLSEGLKASGIGHIESELGNEWPPILFEGNDHHMGTTRMHADPRHGVCDADCRVHGVDNLFVTGTSLFPTYGASNPTLTVLALAFRLADHLNGRLETTRTG